MSSPKGTSKHPQSCMYKDGGSKLVEQKEVEAHKADGWCDNPDEIAAATVDAEVAGGEPEAPESEPEGKGLMGSLKDMVTGGDSSEEPETEEGSTDESEG